MIPSFRFVIACLAAAPIFLLGTLIPILNLVGFLYLISVFSYATLDRLLLPGINKIALNRVIPKRISLGEKTQLSLEIENKSKHTLMIFFAEIHPEHMNLTTETNSIRLKPGQNGIIPYSLVANKRGSYQLEGLDIRLFRPSGILYRQFHVALSTPVEVYPNLVDLKRYDLMVRQGRFSDLGLTPIRRIGMGTEFESMRQYQTGDDISRIDWKVTAKRSNLIVKNYEHERQQHILVAIDVGRNTIGEFEGISRLDYFINATLMLAYTSLSNGDWFSLVAFSDKIESYLPPIRQLGKFEQVATALYKLESKYVESNYDLACRFLSIKNRKRSLMCVMTDVVNRDVNSDLIAYMNTFTKHHISMAVTLKNPEIWEVANHPMTQSEELYNKAAAIDVLEAREEALHCMRHQGVNVIDITPKHLTPTLINRYLTIKAKHQL